MVLPRLLTAVVGAMLFLGAVYFGALPFFFVLLAIVLIGVREFYFLAQQTGYPCYPVLGFCASMLVVVSVFVNGMAFGQATENQGTFALIALIVLALVVRSLLRGPSETSISEWSVTFFGILYVAWSLSHLLLLRDLRPYGRDTSYLLIALIWAADTAAYFVGVRWGRHRIAENVSPKKTWEGTVAGLFGAGLVALLFQMTVLRPWLRPVEAVFLGVGTGILAFVSDLGESVLKRGAGVKDSSQLLPGHGGILDRFDSFLLAAPFFYYYWAFFKH